jgi:SAM-dependent methyltransferase
VTAAFDQVASRYDELWTNTTAGRLQRDAVWHHLKPLYRTGESILDLGCGTGEDALHLERSGVRVKAFDASPAMVDVARTRGADAGVLAMESLSRLEGTFDGALSNFGALNCVQHVASLRTQLARLIRPGGFLALCVIGRFCLWETIHYLATGEPRKAARRWRGTSSSASLGVQVFYPANRQIRRALGPDFRLAHSAGIGVFVPPSYVRGLSEATLETCAALDRRVAHLPGVRSLSDHRLLVFARC